MPIEYSSYTIDVFFIRWDFSGKSYLFLVKNIQYVAPKFFSFMLNRPDNINHKQQYW